jgi:hypothetical protein
MSALCPTFLIEQVAVLDARLGHATVERVCHFGFHDAIAGNGSVGVAVVVLLAEYIADVISAGGD